MAVASSVSTHTTSNGKGLVISVVGAFNLSVHKEFREAYLQNDKYFERYAVNLSACTGLDSSALGMLLLLRDHADVARENLILMNVHRDVKSVLECANFQELFIVRAFDDSKKPPAE